MSIIILKKKSERFKIGEGISGKGKKGFSLNGGYRNQGWVGQDLRGRHLSRTIYRGLEPVGHGGTNGKYIKHILGQPSCSANNPNIIKRSTMSTTGHIATTYVHPTSIFNFDCSGNCRTVMVSVEPQVPDYSIYIAAKAQAAMFCDNIITDGSGSQLTCYTDRYIDNTYTTTQTINLGIPGIVSNTTPDPALALRLYFFVVGATIATEVLNINFASVTSARVFNAGGSYDLPINIIPGINFAEPEGTESFSVSTNLFTSQVLCAGDCDVWFLEYSTVVAETKLIPGCKVSRRIGGKKRPLTPYFKDMRGAETGSWFNEYRVKHNNCLPPPLCKAPWPTTVSRKCQNNYLTPEEAIAAGALPADWMNCLPGTRPGKTNYAFSSY